MIFDCYQLKLSVSENWQLFSNFSILKFWSRKQLKTNWTHFFEHKECPQFADMWQSLSWSSITLGIGFWYRSIGKTLRTSKTEKCMRESDVKMLCICVWIQLQAVLMLSHPNLLIIPKWLLSEFCRSQWCHRLEFWYLIGQLRLFHVTPQSERLPLESMMKQTKSEFAAKLHAQNPTTVSPQNFTILDQNNWNKTNFSALHTHCMVSFTPVAQSVCAIFNNCDRQNRVYTERLLSLPL